MYFLHYIYLMESLLKLIRRFTIIDGKPIEIDMDSIHQTQNDTHITNWQTICQVQVKSLQCSMRLNLAVRLWILDTNRKTNNQTRRLCENMLQDYAGNQTNRYPHDQQGAIQDNRTKTNLISYAWTTTTIHWSLSSYAFRWTGEHICPLHIISSKRGSKPRVFKSDLRLTDLRQAD